MKGFERTSNEGRLATWMESMSGIAQEQIEHGKKKISSGECYPTFPPTPGEFRLLCKSKPEYFQPKPSPKAEPYRNLGDSTRGDFAFWFKGLKEEQKTKLYKGAIKAWPALVELLKISNESYLDGDFEGSIWFTRMVDAFMGYYRISSLRDLR